MFRRRSLTTELYFPQPLSGRRRRTLEEKQPPSALIIILELIIIIIIIIIHINPELIQTKPEQKFQSSPQARAQDLPVAEDDAELGVSQLWREEARMPAERVKDLRESEKSRCDREVSLGPKVPTATPPGENRNREAESARLGDGSLETGYRSRLTSENAREVGIEGEESEDEDDVMARMLQEQARKIALLPEMPPGRTDLDLLPRERTIPVKRRAKASRREKKEASRRRRE
ncbi:hypothetical protein N0V90_001018 [Kalmusia sp. IMI 367209]|nr:hypothetical protein N0V90_001018 [Kalmusia sp. IMI 367209]